MAGTTFGGESRHWLVGALGYKIEIELAPLMVFFQYDDRPGVIGRVGTLFGEAGINIANMAVSRTNEGGKALMALSIDTPAPRDARRGVAAPRASTTPASFGWTERDAAARDDRLVLFVAALGLVVEDGMRDQRLPRACVARSGSSASMPSAKAESATMVRPRPSW